MKFLPSFKTLLWIPLRHYGIAIVILLAGLFLSFTAFRFYQKQEVNRMRAEFDRIADLRMLLIKDTLLKTIEQLDTVKQFFYASPEITKRDFHIFVSNSLRFYPNLLAIGWIETAQHSFNLRDNILGLEFADLSAPPYKIHHFFPFTYLEETPLRKPFIIDDHEYDIFLDLLRKSQHNLVTTVSKRIPFFQDGLESGFFLMNPIFYQGIEGIIVGFSNFDEILKNVKTMTEPTEINISVFDLSNGEEELLYRFQHGPHARSHKKKWFRSNAFRYGNREWKLTATPSSEFIHRHQMHHWNYWEVLIIGLLMSTLTASYFLVLRNRSLHIENEVSERTRELATANQRLHEEIQERQRIKENVAKNQLYLQKRHEALEYLTKFTTSELRSAIHEVILRTAAVMNVNRIAVWFYQANGDSESLHRTGLYTSSTNAFSNHLEFSSNDFPHYFQALSQHYHLILPSSHDVELNQEMASYLAAFKITSKLDIPIVFESKLLGVLSCEETRGVRQWELEDRHFGQTIADIIAIMIQQSARREAEKALQESEERLRFITQQAIDGIISVNEKEEITSWNLGAEQMFGYQEEEILGKQLRVVLPQGTLFLSDKITATPIELKGRHQDGYLFPIEISHTRWQRGEHYFDTIIMRDITERKEYEKRLIQAMKEAKAANESKNEFIATISHELRTPLNAILGFNQCLLMGMDGSINRQQKESLEKIEKSSFHLLNLINDILDWSKIEARRMQLEILPYNIIEIITSSVEEVQSLAKQKNLELTLAEHPPFILMDVDKIRIRQVLFNLLSNAIKFTEKGSILVSLIDEPNQITIHVKDTGIGLAAEELEKIFQPFTQADSSITRKYGGTGLGLIISKQIVDLHKGTITVTSQKGEGSTFTIILPKRPFTTI